MALGFVSNQSGLTFRPVKPMTTNNAGQPETIVTTPVTNEDLWNEIKALRRENTRLSDLVAETVNTVIYTAVKRKENLIQYGRTKDWDRRRKEHERKGWEIIAFQRDSEKAEDRFKAMLRSRGLVPIGGKGFDEVHYLNDAFLSCAREFQWPLGEFTKALSYRKSTPYSSSSNGPFQVGPQAKQGKLWR